MPRREEFLSNMRDALQSLDPGWDISPGTPEFKILEAVASQLENVSIDGLLSTYHFDIDKKSGIDLDRFLSLWGFYRLKGSRATGSVTFRRATPALSNISIPVGTQVSVRSTGNQTIFFSTVAGAAIVTNGTEVTVPIEASTGGLIGNVGSYAINSFATNLAGVTEVFNASPITGGSNSESDEALRERFRRTFMRNVSGTENQFSAVAYQETAFVNRVNSISAVERYNEQIQLVKPSDLTATTPYVVTRNTDIDGDTITFTDDEFKNVPNDDFFVVTYDSTVTPVLKNLHKLTKTNTPQVFTITPEITDADIRTLKVVFPTSAQDAKFIYPSGGEVVGVNVGGDNEIIAKSGDATPDYQMLTLNNDWDKAEAANATLPVFYFTKSGITRLGGFGTIVDISYEYTPIVSRNNPPDVVNKLDIFVDGIDEWSIQEQINMPNSEENVFGDSAGPNASEFIREDGTTHPQEGHLFTPLGRAPIVTLGEEISVQRFINTDHPSDLKYSIPNAITYYRDEDYWLIKRSEDALNVKGSQRAIEGIEWKTPIRLEDQTSHETYIFPRRGPDDNVSEDLDAPFTLTSQNDGNLSGYYAYVVTWEVDGRESLPSHAVANLTELNNNKLLVRFDDYHSKYPGVYIDEDAEDKTIYRRFYRSKSASSKDSALLGPFYLVNIVRNNYELASWIDNKVDDDLGMSQPPKAPPPNAVPLDITYSYNSLIERLDLQMESVRLVGQDILSHQAELVPIKFNFAVVLTPNASAVAVRNAIQSAINNFLSRKEFSGNLQLADLFAVIESVTEVDNVRLINAEESSNESYRLELSSNSSTFASSDTITFTVDGNSTSSLFANENSYTIREALEALPSVNEGDTYAAFLVNTLLEGENELYVQGNENSERIHNLVTTSEFPIYLQITQFGSSNLNKDEIVKVVSSTKQTLNNSWNGTVNNYTISNGVATLTTATPHALNIGDAVHIGFVSEALDSGLTVTFDATTDKVTLANHGYSNGDKVKFDLIQTTTGITNNTEYYVINASTNDFKIAATSSGSAINLTNNGKAIIDPVSITVIGVTNDTFSFNVVASNASSTPVTGGKISTRIGASFRIKFIVDRAQLGSKLSEYESDVTNLNTLAWIHLLGDVAIAKQGTTNGATFIITFLPNAFSQTNNWGLRSLIDIDGNRRVFVETSGDFTSTGLVVRTTGQGYGLEVLGNNLQTVLERHLDDIYFLSNELPIFGGIDISVRARNTF